MATDDDKRKNRLGLSLPAADQKNKAVTRSEQPEKPKGPTEHDDSSDNSAEEKTPVKNDEAVDDDKNEDDEHTGVDKETGNDHSKRECPDSLKGPEQKETKVTAQKGGPGTKKYRVTGSPIAPFGNKKSFGPEARMYMPGEVVNLTAAQAKHYVNQRRLEPYIDDEE